MKAIINFKAKIKRYKELKDNNIVDGNEYFKMKVGLSRHDIENIGELSSHWGINSDLMPKIILRGIKAAFGKDNIPDYITIDDKLPACISIERSFLSTIRIVIDI